MRLPFITALCPTYRHPELLANSLALWLLQHYPLDRRLLLILDDGGTFADCAGVGPPWSLRSESARAPSLPAKYNRLLAMARQWCPWSDAYLVWEDDDIYLPGYVSAHARCLADHEVSKPVTVLGDYTGALVGEVAEGRFHSSLGFRRELIERIGGWPDTKRADFDQQLIARLNEATHTERGETWVMPSESQFIYSWHTGAAHGQHTMRSPDDETWYDRAPEVFAPVPHVGRLEPKLDERTKRRFAELGLRTEAIGVRR